MSDYVAPSPAKAFAWGYEDGFAKRGKMPWLRSHTEYLQGYYQGRSDRAIPQGDSQSCKGKDTQ